MANIKRVSPAEAKNLIDEQGYLYVDVRSEAEYAAGHPAGAHNVPLLVPGPRGMAQNRDFLDVVEALYPKDAKIVAGCKSGGRSARAVEMMIAAGYSVCQAENAADAVRCLERAKSSPLVVVLDLKLPDSHDLSLARRIIAERPDAPVIMMTAHGSALRRSTSPPRVSRR